MTNTIFPPVRIAWLLIALLLTGCSTLAWKRADTSDAQLRQDMHECKQWARTAPALPDAPSAAGYRLNCAVYGHQADCIAAPGPLQRNDGSDTERAAATAACLTHRGYIRVRLPAR